MANCAVCQLIDGLVINIIVADPTDPPYDGTQLIEIFDGVMCDIGWVWDGTQFVNPNPDPLPSDTPTDSGAPV